MPFLGDMLVPWRVIMPNSQQTKKNTSCLNHRTQSVFVPERTYIYICTVLSHTSIINRGIQSHKPSTTIISYMYIFRIDNLQLHLQTRVKSMSAKYTWNTQPFIYSKKTHILLLLFTSFRPACCKKWGIVSSVLTGHTAVGIQCLLGGSHGNKMVQECKQQKNNNQVINHI